MRRLLLVDDDPFVARYTAAVIRRRGLELEVRAVSSCAAALESLAAERFDAVVLDLGLPDCAGIQAVERVRAVTDVPILVSSGASNLERPALEAGAAGFVGKAEFDAAAFERALVRVLGGALR